MYPNIFYCTHRQVCISTYSFVREKDVSTFSAARWYCRQPSKMQDPPTQSTAPPSRDPPPSSESSTTNITRRRPREPIHTPPTTTKNDPPAQHLMTTIPRIRTLHQQTRGIQYYQPMHNGGPITNNSGGGVSVSRGRDTPTLRRRSSKTLDQPSSYNSNYRHNNNYSINIDENITGDRLVFGDSSRQRQKEAVYSPSKSKKSKKTKQKPISIDKWSRICTSVILCTILMVLGIGGGIRLVRSAIHIIFRNNGKQGGSNYYKESNIMNEETVEDESNRIGLRGASDANDDISISQPDAERTEDLSGESQIINSRPTDGNAQDVNAKNNMHYMDQVSTKDFFFAGAVDVKKRIVNSKGRIETINSPGHTYADIPFLLDSNPFAISVWINLLPISDNEERGHGPRVILSTRSKGYLLGCSSTFFGERADTGMILYAQDESPSSGRTGKNNDKTYRIILEYAITRNRSCQNLVGPDQTKDLLVREGEWNHIVIFATKTSKKGKERMSMYVNGGLAARTEPISREFLSHLHPESKTIIGRYATSDGELSKKNFDLDGTVAMLSYWETGGSSLLSDVSKQMTIQSESDEDRVVKTINRAAFDTQAIQGLSNQGLTVKDPTLLYTFEQKEKERMNDLYTDAPAFVNELMSGKNGKIISELKDGMPIHQRQAFIPLGGNRYAEYKDGTYIPEKLNMSDKLELDEVARVRSGIVREAMQHAWNGYKKYAFGKDELLPISNGGQDNWGGMGTTLVDSLRYVGIVDSSTMIYYLWFIK